MLALTATARSSGSLAIVRRRRHCAASLVPVVAASGAARPPVLTGTRPTSPDRNLCPACRRLC